MTAQKSHEGLEAPAPCQQPMIHSVRRLYESEESWLEVTPLKDMQNIMAAGHKI